MVLSGDWAPGISDEQCDELELDGAAFATTWPTPP
jgi:hypothetical protein